MGRTALSVFFALLGIVLVPLSLVPVWAKTHLLNTDNFVEQFEPLSTSPVFLRAVAAEVGDATTQAIVNSTSDTFLSQLGLGDLVGDAADGLGTFVEAQTLSIVQSDQFPPLWNDAVRQLHGQLVDSILGGEDHFELGIQVAPLVTQLRTNLTAEGVLWAQLIPELRPDVTIPLVDVELPPAATTVFRLLDVFNWGLPLLAVACLTLSLVIARKRAVTLAMCGLGIAATSVGSMLVLPRIGPLVLTNLVEGVPLQSIMWSLATQPLETWLALIGVIGLGTALLGLIISLIKRS